MWNAPVAYTIRLLEAFIGDNYRRESCLFVKRMHASIDVLEEQARAIGSPKIRHEILHHLCYALAKRPRTRTDFMERDAYETEHNAIAFILAMAAGYNDVVDAMLEARTVRPDQQAWDFGHFIDIAISLGSTNSAQALIEHGATIDNSYWSQTCQALQYAAEVGHVKVLELVLASMPIDQDHHTFRTYGEVIRNAAKHQQWDVVNQLLDNYMYDIEEEQLKSILSWAAKYGQDSIISLVLDAELCNHYLTFSRGKNFPLGQAAYGGHLSTCRLIIDKAAWWHVHPSRSEVMARFVGIGGNVDIYHLFKAKDAKVWKQWHEMHFLPLAAEHGHLEFAKFAVAKGCDRHPKPKHRDMPHELEWYGEGVYPGDIRYFALLRAVVSGHLDIVRWLVEDVGVDVNNKAKLGADAELLPLVLAVDTGRVDMAKLLRCELGAEPIPEAIEKRYAHAQSWKARSGRLDNFRRLLHLREDYDSTHFCLSSRKIAAALAVATTKG